MACAHPAVSGGGTLAQEEAPATPATHGHGANWRLDPLGLGAWRSQRGDALVRRGGVGGGARGALTVSLVSPPQTEGHPGTAGHNGGNGVEEAGLPCGAAAAEPGAAGGAGALGPSTPDPPVADLSAVRLRMGGGSLAGLGQPLCLIPTPCPQVLPGPGPSPAAAAPARRGLAAPVPGARVAPGRPAVRPECGHHAAATG